MNKEEDVMSKRDDLDKEAKGEKGLFAALLVGTGMLIANSMNKSNKKENLKMQIDSKDAEISSVERQISEEEGKFFLFRDDSKISSLKQKRNQLIEEKNNLVAQYKKL